MAEALKNFFRFLVFRNVFIAFCAMCMVWETQLFFGIPIVISPLILFVFSAAFFEYNLHVIGGRLTISNPRESIRLIFSSAVSPILRACILSGFTATLITFFLLDSMLMAGFLIAGLITLSYTLPLVRFRGKVVRTREITYLKVLAVAMGWTLATVVVPLLPELKSISLTSFLMIFFRRLLFIYAITIPFEIRDMERERKIGNVSLPMVYGVRTMKKVGLLMLLLFCSICALHEEYLLIDLATRKNIFYPLAVSAIVAAGLILFASEKRNNWYFKFWTDGTMVLQFLLLFLFNE